MNLSKIRKAPVIILFAGAMPLAGCSAQQLAENTGDAVGLVGRATVQTVVGAGKLIFKGTGKVLKSIGNDDP